MELILDDAKNFILGQTKRSEKQWLPFFDSLQIKIAIIDYNKEGAEGISSRGEGGISTGFLGITDYPDSIMKPLNSHRLVTGVRSSKE